jgi:hypothetical protein
MGKMKSQPKNMSTLSRDQQAVAGDLKSYWGEMFSQGATPYQGSFLGETLPQYGTVTDLINQSATGHPLAQQSQNALAQILSGKTQYRNDPHLGEASFRLDPKTTDKYFNDAIKQPMLQAFDRDIMPRLNDQFAGMGATFSTRKGDAGARALSDLTSNLTAARSDLAYKDQSLAASLAESAAGRRLAMNQMNAQFTDSAQARMLQGIGMQSNLANRPLQDASIISGLLQPLQGRQDAAAQMGYQDFLRTTQENNPYINQMLAFLGSNQTAQYTQPGWGGALAGGIGGLLTGGMLGVGMGTSMGLGGLGALGGMRF